jgi:hypothetical protein
MSAATTTTVESAIERLREWELAGGRFQGPQEVPILSSWNEGSDHRFNLKNKSQKRFLQWEHQTFGINLGYTDDATQATAHKVNRWFFRRSGSGTGPVLFGENLAIGYGTAPSFYKYEDRTVGVNIGNTGNPAYEWRFIGAPGSAGKPVKTGDWMAIYNEVENGFLIYFDRDAGVDLGWPDSKTWSEQGFDWATDAAKKVLEDYVKQYIAG